MPLPTLCLCFATDDKVDAIAKSIHTLPQDVVTRINYIIVTHHRGTMSELTGMPPMDIHKVEWIHSAFNYSYAVSLCRGFSDYVLLLEPGDVIHGILPMDDLTEECYSLAHVMFAKERSFYPRLFKNMHTISWQLDTPYELASNQPVSIALTGDYYIEGSHCVHQVDGDLFQKANTLYGQRQLDEAFILYEQLSESKMPSDSLSEQYYSLYQMGQIMAAKQQWDAALGYYHRCWQLCPQRAEPLYKLVARLRETNQFVRANEHTEALVQCVAPCGHGIGVDIDVYTWGRYDEAGIICYYSGQYWDSFVYSQRALLAAPPELLPRLTSNRQFALDKLNVGNKRRSVLVVHGYRVLAGELLEYIRLLEPLCDFVFLGTPWSPPCGLSIGWETVGLAELEVWADMVVYYDTFLHHVPQKPSSLWLCTEGFHLTVPGRGTFPWCESKAVTGLLSQMTHIIAPPKVAEWIHTKGVPLEKVHKLHPGYTFPWITKGLVALDADNKLVLRHLPTVALPTFADKGPADVIDKLRRQSEPWLSLSRVIPKGGDRLTFTITTCKRLDCFRRTMESFLTQCQDYHIIDRWVLIDDHSSVEDRRAMQEEYPFFDFIFRDGEKGHVQSMNQLWNTVSSTYVLHFEDDWEVQHPITLTPVLQYLEKHPRVGQVVLKAIGHSRVQHPATEDGFYRYVYNPDHRGKPELNLIYDSVKRYPAGTGNDHNSNWWWPGFTLNPSIMCFRRYRNTVGLFNERLPLELFEYDYAMRVHIRGVETHFVPHDIRHVGKVSSYRLNDTHRFYD